jgi:hypothetical protein
MDEGRGSRVEGRAACHAVSLRGGSVAATLASPGGPDKATLQPYRDFLAEVRRVMYHRSMARDTRLFPALTMAALAISCGGTRAVPLTPTPKFAAGQPVSVWQGTAATELTHVRVVNDTILGWPSIACDSCRASIPLSEVDSLTVKSGNEWAWLVPLGAAAATMIVWRATDSD